MIKYRIDQYADTNSFRVLYKKGPCWLTAKELVVCPNGAYSRARSFSSLEDAKAYIEAEEKAVARRKVGWHTVWP